MPGPGHKPHGPRPKIKNPGKLFSRLMQFIMKNYGLHLVIVFICIIVSVLANIQGTLFTQHLIDDYIMPMIKNHSSDYGPLLAAILRVAVFYLIGVACTFIYQKIMIYVSQGCIKQMRDDLFTHMQDLPIKYFDTNNSSFLT